MLASPFTFSPVFLYAETHFRFFPFFPSLLFRKQPEIVFDAPARLDPGRDLPVVLIINDILRFPAKPLEVTVCISRKSSKPQTFLFSDITRYEVQHPFAGQCSAYLFYVKREILGSGRIFINCKAKLQGLKGLFEVLNDNFFSSSKLPFSCFISDDFLPCHGFCSYGDLHVHSQYSQSQVEFGPPVSVIDLMSKSCGLDFLAITDHSYDLSCSMDDYLKNDEELRRWSSYISEITNYHGYGSIVMGGEEISCFNSRKKTIHLCAIGTKEFIPGSIDGARQNPFAKNHSTLLLQDSIRLIHKQQGLAIAAHPGSKFGFLQKLLLRRGKWNQEDMMNDLDGIQAVNNGFEKSWIISKNLWVNELLNDHRLSLIAGNDSHGDFNRYRTIAMPFILISENFNRYLSSAKTGIYKKVISQSDIITEIQKGATFVTSGPFLALSTSDSISDNVIGKNDISVMEKTIIAIIKSSYEFGFPKNLCVFYGKFGACKESIVFSENFNEKTYSLFRKIPLEFFNGKGYVRAETTCLNDEGKSFVAATSACYLTN